MKMALILGDQLSHSLSVFDALDKQADLLVMAEVDAEATYTWHHKQKIALIFSAMRHFAQELRQAGWQVHYHEYDAQHAQLSLLDVLQAVCEQYHPDSLAMTECGEYRLHYQMTVSWQSALNIPVVILQDDRFFCSKTQFATWADERKQLRMEYFYREMRKHSGLLMQGPEPVGHRWNFDADNREAYRGDVPVPKPLRFLRDDTDVAVCALVQQHFADHPGTLAHFNWPTTRSQALTALSHFIEHRLPHFGRFQDAMQQHDDFMFHSLLSTSLNCGLLLPREVCDAAEQAWHQGLAPLNAVEGFIRQILGWREYVRGLYWLKMPDYADMNTLGNTRDLPAWYWTGETRMNCMRACLRNTLDHAYAHHIQRLMVTGNFALLTGIEPRQICDWYLAVYADAYDWVELPNTLGMVMHADGGLLASKPYAASGSYIHRMSDYCQHCPYNVKTATEHDSCPFNSLYWHFIGRHATQFAGNPRMSMIYRSYQRMPAEKRLALVQKAESLLETIDAL